MTVANSKSTLAKLLAQENITVEHRKAQTASFDPKNRVLILPIWKEMSNNLYDLLVGHEVGHAWETPAEGWHNALSGNKPGFKSYLNVIEDARIERKIKSRYPGLAPAFYGAYKELFDQNFFGVADTDISTLPLIDRINLHFKLGSLTMVPFSIAEKVIIKEIELANTWDEVVDIATRLYVQRKEELEEKFEEEYAKVKDIDDLAEGEESDDDDFPLDYYENKFDEEDPASLTDTEFRNRESDLISDDSKPYRYASIPKINCQDFIVKHKILYSNPELNTIESDAMANFTGKELQAKYKATNSKFIQYLVKEFELKRNAAQFARAKVSKTGELDIDKVFGYKYNNDLFKRVTQIPNGKNHGMIMFLDWSGSMESQIEQTLEQTMVLSDFCKKVNIPFKVFAFSNDSISYNYDENRRDNNKRQQWLKYTGLDLDKKKFKYSEGDLYMEYHNNEFRVNEILSNDMTLAEYNFAQQRLLVIAKFCQYGRRSYIPENFRMSGTPLNHAIVFANSYVPQFKAAYRLDIVNTIFLTDGEADDTDRIVVEDKDDIISSVDLNVKYGIGYRQGCNTAITDKTTGKTGYAKPGQSITVALLNLLKENTQTNLIGYFIIYSGSRRAIDNFFYRNGATKYNLDQIMLKLRREKFIDVMDQGYDKYFIIPASDLTIENSEIEVNADASKKDFLKAFMKKQKAKLINRVLLNRFIAEIA
jgi:hypothetical protein